MSGSLIEYSEKGVGKGVREHHTGRICMLSVNFVIGHVHNNECHVLFIFTNLRLHPISFCLAELPAQIPEQWQSRRRALKNYRD